MALTGGPAGQCHPRPRSLISRGNTAASSRPLIWLLGAVPDLRPRPAPSLTHCLSPRACHHSGPVRCPQAPDLVSLVTASIQGLSPASSGHRRNCPAYCHPAADHHQLPAAQALTSAAPALGPQPPDPNTPWLPTSPSCPHVFPTNLTQLRFNKYPSAPATISPAHVHTHAHTPFSGMGGPEAVPALGCELSTQHPLPTNTFGSTRLSCPTRTDLVSSLVFHALCTPRPAYIPPLAAPETFPHILLLSKPSPSSPSPPNAAATCLPREAFLLLASDRQVPRRVEVFLGLMKASRSFSLKSPNSESHVVRDSPRIRVSP